MKYRLVRPMVWESGLDPLGGWGVFVVIAIAAIALAGWAYWRTPAPLTPTRRTALWVARALALVMVLLMLARPVAVIAERGDGRGLARAGAAPRRAGRGPAGGADAVPPGEIPPHRRHRRPFSDDLGSRGAAAPTSSEATP